MKFTSEKHFNLTTIGNISFSWKQVRNGNKDRIYIGALHILHDTDAPISKETEKALLKEMKKAKTDLLTDGVDFYTTRGNKITMVRHPRFTSLFEEASEEKKKEIFEIRFGSSK